VKSVAKPRCCTKQNFVILKLRIHARNHANPKNTRTLWHRGLRFRESRRRQTIPDHDHARFFQTLLNESISGSSRVAHHRIAAAKYSCLDA